MIKLRKNDEKYFFLAMLAMTLVANISSVENRQHVCSLLQDSQESVHDTHLQLMLYAREKEDFSPSQCVIPRLGSEKYRESAAERNCFLPAAEQYQANIFSQVLRWAAAVAGRQREFYGSRISYLYIAN